MANRQLRIRVIGAAYYVIGVAGVIALIASRAHSWRDWIFYVGLCLGFGGMAYLLRQWRGANSVVARNWLIPAFGSWWVAVFVMSSSQTAGYVIAALGLLTGFGGAVTVFRGQRRESHS